MKQPKIIMGVIIAIAFSGAAVGQGVSSEPGYLDLREVERWFDVEPSIEVNIQGALLRLVAAASRLEDPELAELLYDLKSIQVRGFPSAGPLPDGIRERRDELAIRLEKEGWDTVVRVRNRGDNVDMFVKTEDEAIAGLVVLVLENDDDETVFVNIVGQIDPDQIGRIGRRFDIGELENW